MMFRSIFGKMLAVFISILLIGSLISGITLNYFLSSYMLEEKIDLVEQSGNVIKLVAEENLGDFSKITLIYFRSLLKFYKDNNRFMIWIVDSEGRILIADNPLVELSIPGEILSLMKRESGYFVLPDSRQYTKVMQGNGETILEQGYFYGLFSRTDMPWLTVQIPISYNGKIVAAVFVNTPIPEIQKAQNAILRMFIISTLISVLISSIIALAYSRMFKKPLKKLNSAAKDIAEGKFSERIDLSSRDEIGDLAKSFNQMTEKLENLEDMRSSFIANVSHELRTPMTSMQGFIEGILDGTVPAEKERDYLRIVRDETIRLSRLVNDLMQLTRMEAGEIEINYSEFDINEIIRLNIISLENQISVKGIDVEVNFIKEKLFIRSDVDMVQRIVLNLLHNAVKYTPEKGVITVSTELKKGKVLVSIADNGIGIPEEDLGRIWDRFYKADKSRGRDKTGTGLGLAIVKGLVSRLGQEIQVSSKPGKGTEFVFTLDLSFTIEN